MLTYSRMSRTAGQKNAVTGRAGNQVSRSAPSSRVSRSPATRIDPTPMRNRTGRSEGGDSLDDHADALTPEAGGRRDTRSAMAKGCELGPFVAGHVARPQ
jgi:hypothetical protein